MSEIRIKSLLPKEVSQKDKEEIREKVDALSSTLSQKFQDGGSLLVSFYGQRDSYGTISKVAKDLMDLDFIYSFRNIQNDPSLLEEYQTVLESIKVIEKVVGKRKKKRNEAYRKKKNQKEVKEV